MWTQILKDASPGTVRRVASFTDEIQPSCDDVGKDDASDRDGEGDRRYEQVEGGWTADGMSVLTGNESSGMGRGSTTADLQEKLGTGHAVVLGSKNKPLRLP